MPLHSALAPPPAHTHSTPLALEKCGSYVNLENRCGAIIASNFPQKKS